MINIMNHSFIEGSVQIGRSSFQEVVISHFLVVTFDRQTDPNEID